MPLKFPEFQINDLASIALLDGAILAWEQGLGKSLAAIALPLIKRCRRVLIVAPDDLHRQHKESALSFFQMPLTSLDRVEQIGALGLNRPHADDLPPRFFITSYHALGYNHADEWPPTVDDDAIARTSDARGKARLADLGQLQTEYARARLGGRQAIDGFEWFKNIGHEKTFETRNADGGTRSITIRCVWKPTLARVLAHLDCFDCVIVDEATIIQANEAHLALGVRLLQPKVRYLMSGTPIKNRLESLFWLMHWACGSPSVPTPRFPYEGNSEAREQFANQHLQHDRFLTREEEAEAAWRATHGKSRTFRMEKRTARICNIQRLWKITAPIILRRRKDECGLPIVEKIVKPLWVRPGTMQQKVYAFHLAHPPLAARATPTKAVDRRVQIGMQLGTLRLAALCPHAPSLDDTVTHNSRFKGVVGPKKSFTDLNPKSAGVLGLIADLIAEGEQVIVGSPFDDFNQSLHRRLQLAGVSSVLLNGGVSPTRRGQHAALFKRQEFSVVVAGLKAMGKGHSFECARHLILPAMSYALDENEQFIHRVWRLTSRSAVSIWQFIMANTIDEVLLQGFSDKLDSAQLALDGQLVEATVETVDVAEVLARAVRNFDPLAETVDEHEMEAQWRDSLCTRLTAAEHAFRARHGKTRATLEVLDEPSPLSLALATLRRAKRSFAA